jgi:hypothetical protein
MTYVVGDAGMPAGGVLKIGLPNMGWGEPYTPYARGDFEIYKGEKRQICRYKKCNTTGKIESKGKADIYLYHRGSQNLLGPYNNWSWWITAAVENESLYAGDKIIITYGDTAFGEKGALVQPWAEKDRIWFSAFVDTDGSGNFVQVSGSPVICSVVPGPLEKCIITVPSIIKREEPFDIKISLTDWGNDPVDVSQAGQIESITIRDAQANPVNSDGLCGDSSLDRITGITADKDTFYEVEVETKDKKIIKAQSNPVICTEGDLSLYWGDLHTHSFYHQYNEKLGYGDPCTSPEELIKYAREVTHLDFIALTDGRGALPDNKGWQEGQQAVIDNYKEGDFVTLKGWEIQMGTDGHRNVIHRDAVIENNYTDAVFKDADIWGDVKGNGMSDILDFYHGREDVILIPHHPMVWMNWDHYDRNLDRLVEIYSCWGSSEHPRNLYWDKASLPGLSVVEALNRGYKLGFVGGSDSHTGYPGRSINNADRYKFCCYKAGYTAVYAEKCTRESIFDSLRNRRCYATTGARIILDFAVDDACMGQTVPLDKAGKHHRIHIRVTGTDIISRIEVVCDGETVKTIKPYKACFEDEWVDDTEAAEKAGYYYLRVFQADGNAAWASPVWMPAPSCRL